MHKNYIQEVAVRAAPPLVFVPPNPPYPSRFSKLRQCYNNRPLHCRYSFHFCAEFALRFAEVLSSTRHADGVTNSTQQRPHRSTLTGQCVEHAQCSTYNSIPYIRLASKPLWKHHLFQRASHAGFRLYIHGVERCV